LALAIDREEIIKGAFWGAGTPINQKGIPGTYWYFPLKEQKRDLEKARTLLREAGFPNGIKTKFHVRKGEDQEAQVIQAQLRQAGIDAELDLSDFANYTARHRAGDFDITLSGGSVGSDPDPNYAENFATEPGKERLHNRSGWSNPRADQLLREGRITIDPQKRRKIYQEVVELINEEAPQIFTLLTPYVFAYRNHVKGFKTDPDGRYFSAEGGVPVAWIEK
jgi:peptide/nickel transport system substrate-binding protein